MVFMVCRLSYASEFLHFLRLLEAIIGLHVLSVMQIDQSVFLFVFLYMLYIYIKFYILCVQFC